MRASERFVGTAASKVLSERLPAGWLAAWHDEQARESRLDGMLDVVAPNGERVIFGAEVKAALEPRDVPHVAAVLKLAHPQGPHLVIAPFIGSRSREILIAQELSFIDLTGNVRVSSEQPAIFIETHGEDKNPKRSLRPRSSLRGPITGRVVRFLCEHQPPYGVRDIASRTNVDPGAVSRILDFASSEKLIDRNDRGKVSAVAWKDLIAYWAKDLAKDRVERLALEPHGIQAVLSRLQDTPVHYAITGPQAASFLASAAPVVRVDLYVDDADSAIEALELHAPVQTGNVRLIQAYDEVVFEGTFLDHGLAICNPVQIAADLTTLRGRSREELTVFLEWMERHERNWRQ
ncbi:MAG TPA: hypothetical protein VIJ12_05080 [Candidatus Baltobacteraceae bacterium]